MKSPYIASAAVILLLSLVGAPQTGHACCGASPARPAPGPGRISGGGGGVDGVALGLAIAGAAALLAGAAMQDPGTAIPSSIEGPGGSGGTWGASTNVKISDSTTVVVGAPVSKQEQDMTAFIDGIGKSAINTATTKAVGKVLTNAGDAAYNAGADIAASAGKKAQDYIKNLTQEPVIDWVTKQALDNLYSWYLLNKSRILNLKMEHWKLYDPKWNNYDKSTEPQRLQWEKDHAHFDDMLKDLEDTYNGRKAQIIAQAPQ